MIGLPSQHRREDVVGQNADGGDEKQAPEQIKQADFSKSVRCRESLGVNHDLKDWTSSSEGLNVETPGEAREKQAGHKQKIPGKQQCEPKKYPHDVGLRPHA